MQTYEELRGHPADFLVRYRLYATSAGGRMVTYQHLRCDFMYDGDDAKTDGIYMIHPEFLEQNGMPLEENVPVPLEGYATMWILMPEMRQRIHRARIRVGTWGYFMEGSRKIGEVVVEAVISLHENPT